MDKSERTQSISPAHITQTDFQEWSNLHMYRTSYRDMQQNSPASNKKFAIPGYAGHVPGFSSDNPYGKRFTLISKELFSRDKTVFDQKNRVLTQRPGSVSPNLLKSSKRAGFDDKYQTISHFHGKCTIPESHPNFNTKERSSSYKTSFKDQESIRPTLYRNSNIEVWKKKPCFSSQKFKASGFAQNNALFDGFGWVSDSKRHGDMSYSEYRKRFSGCYFHPSPLKPKTRRLKRKKLVY